MGIWDNEHARVHDRMCWFYRSFGDMACNCDGLQKELPSDNLTITEGASVSPESEN